MERLLCPIGQSDVGDGGSRLLQRRGGGLQNKRFSVVLLDAPMVAMKTMPEMFPSFPFRGILTTVVLLPPAFPLTIHLR